jgi:hypothetical protein
VVVVQLVFGEMEWQPAEGCRCGSLIVEASRRQEIQEEEGAMFRRLAIVVILGLLITAIAVPTLAGSGSTRVTGELDTPVVKAGKLLTEGNFTWNIDEVFESAPFDLDGAGGPVWEDVVMTSHVDVKLNHTTFQGRYWGYVDLVVAVPAITCQGSLSGKVDFAGVTEGPLRATCSDGSALKAQISTSNIADPVPLWELDGRVTS